MKANQRVRGRDEGQVLILAGVVLILAFLLAAFAVTELNSEQQHLQRGTESDLPKLFRETREKVANTMDGLAYTAIDNTTLLSRFDSTRSELEQQGRARGVNVVLRLANGSDLLAPRAELANFTSGNGASCNAHAYNMVSYNASRDYTGWAWDCGDDGIVYDVTTGRIKGVLIYLFLSDPAARLEETFAVALN
jgi:hypothetical protein